MHDESSFQDTTFFLMTIYIKLLPIILWQSLLGNLSTTIVHEASVRRMLTTLASF